MFEFFLNFLLRFSVRSFLNNYFSLKMMVKPLCPYFGACGGCTAQHIDYALQLENKKKQLQQITKQENIHIFSEEEYYYRNRMDFIFQNNGLGLRKKGHWDKIVPIEQCVIAEEKVNFLMKEIQTNLKKFDAFDLRKHTGTFRYAVIRSTEEECSISFVLNSKSMKLSDAIESIKSFAKMSTAENILITYVPPETDMSISSEYFVIKGKDSIKTSYVGKQFSYPIQGFFQNNHTMAEKMQGYVKNLLQKYATKNAILLDLYAGVGTFGIMNAGSFKKVLIVENVKEAIYFAEKNAKENYCTNVQTIAMDAKQIAQLEYAKPLFVITDPPRSGMDQKTMTVLNQEKPECIIYISCNPEQLAKDLPKLRNYHIKSAALFDLFPQTKHSEAVIEVVKINEERTKEEY